MTVNLLYVVGSRNVHVLSTMNMNIRSRQRNDEIFVDTPCGHTCSRHATALMTHFLLAKFPKDITLTIYI